MNNRHKKTLRAVYATPPSKSIDWEDIEALLLAVGARMSEGRGSRVKFDLNGQTVAFHKPHNPKTLRAYQIVVVREFLAQNEVKP